jgi:hypothetical protein
MKTSASQYHVSSFRIVISGIKLHYSSFPIPGDYEKRLFSRNFWSRDGLSRARVDPQIGERKNFPSEAGHVLAFLLGVVSVMYTRAAD